MVGSGGCLGGGGRFDLIEVVIDGRKSGGLEMSEGACCIKCGVIIEEKVWGRCLE